jgi:transmembrane sensor
MTGHATDFRASISRDAARWFAVLRNDECPAATRKAFELWLLEKPEHAAAFRQVEYAWAAAAGLENEPRSLHLRHAAIRSGTGRRRRRTWRIVAGVAGALAAASWLFLAVDMGIPVPGDAGDVGGQAASGGQVIETAVGERSTFLLEDGSSVELNTSTELRVLFSDERREILLLRGQALFDVAPDPERRFIVFAADRRITALGTEFEVRLDRSEVAVTLLEGNVEVALLSVADDANEAQPLKVVNLEPGQRVSGDLEVTRTVSTDDLKRALSWRQGRLAFKDERLSDVIYEINRYSSNRVQLADAALGELKVSGSFKAGSVENFASALTAIYPLESTSHLTETGAKVITVRERQVSTAPRSRN